jgi:hypothetical protein
MATAADVIAKASLELGKPYVFGDEGPGSFDCSGLIQWVFDKVGIALPRRASQQQAATTQITGTPIPGDLVFWGTPAHHVGLYIGGGKMINAAESGTPVRIQNVWGDPTYHRVAGLTGGGLATVTATAQTAIATTVGFVPSAADVKGVVIGALFAAAGLGLIALGAWRATKGGGT